MMFRVNNINGSLRSYQLLVQNIYSLPSIVQNYSEFLFVESESFGRKNEHRTVSALRQQHLYTSFHLYADFVD